MKKTAIFASILMALGLSAPAFAEQPQQAAPQAPMPETAPATDFSDTELQNLPMFRMILKKFVMNIQVVWKVLKILTKPPSYNRKPARKWFKPFKMKVWMLRHIAISL